MATRAKASPSAEPAVTIEQTPSGDYAIGGKIGDTFYPFVTASRAHVEAYIGKHASSSSSSDETTGEEG